MFGRAPGAHENTANIETVDLARLVDAGTRDKCVSFPPVQDASYVRARQAAGVGEFVQNVLGAFVILKQFSRVKRYDRNTRVFFGLFIQCPGCLAAQNVGESCSCTLHSPPSGYNALARKQVPSKRHNSHENYTQVVNEIMSYFVDMRIVLYPVRTLSK